MRRRWRSRKRMRTMMTIMMMLMMMMMMLMLMLLMMMRRRRRMLARMREDFETFGTSIMIWAYSGLAGGPLGIILSCL
eukprot:8084148-Pyramimonas_sp.AAC.1